jgi:hypothetical protein
MTGSAQQPPRVTRTYAKRIEDYGNFATRSSWIAGGVVAVTVVASGDLGANVFDDDGASQILGAVSLTLALLAGALAASARVEFSWQATLIDRKRAERRLDNDSELHTDDTPFPDGSQKRMEAALILLVLAGVALIVAVWIAALG